MRSVLVVGFVSILSLSADAQVTSIGPFAGSDKETFESQSATAQPCVTGRIFSNQADLCTPAGNGVYISSSWGFSCSLGPHGGSRFCGTGGATGGGGIDIAFDMPIARFGGYFAMNHSQGPDFTVSFYAGSNLVSGPTVVQQAVDCTWNWHGWDMNGAPVDRIHLASNYSSTGYLHMDDFEVDFDPPQITTYGAGCAGTGGIVPELLMTGSPVLGQQVLLTLAQGLGGAQSMTLIGAAQTNAPIGGDCSLLVQLPALQLFIPLNGAGAGTGNYSLPGIIPPTSPLGPVYFQALVADPASVTGFSMSNGLKVDIQ